MFEVNLNVRASTEYKKRKENTKMNNKRVIDEGMTLTTSMGYSSRCCHPSGLQLTITLGNKSRTLLSLECLIDCSFSVQA